MNTKRSFSLTKLLRLVCTGLEILILVGLLASVAMAPFAEWFLYPGSAIRISKSPTTGAFTYNFRLSGHHDVNLTNDGSAPAAGQADKQPSVSVGPFPLLAGKEGQFLKDGTGAKDVDIRNLEGMVEFKGPQRALDALRAFKWPALASELCAYLGSLVIFEMLRRLLASAEKGEMFTDANVRALRRFGCLIIGLDLLKFAASVTLLGRMRSFAAPFFADGALSKASSLAGAFGGVVTGLAFLLVAEVFREGLKFRKDSDLTI